MPGTVVLTLGRLPKALDLARSFARAGWRVVVAEPHRRHLTGISRSVARSVAVTAPTVDRARYLEELAAVVRAEAAALVVPVSEETLHVAHLPPLLPQGVTVLTMPPALVLALHDKGGFVRHAQAHGLDVPDSAPLGTAEAAALAATGPVVLKPLHACGGRGVTLPPEGAPLPAPDPDAPLLVQRRILGEEFSTCSLAHAGRVRGTAIYRPTLKTGTVAAGFERVDHPAIADWVARFIASTAWTGFIAFDLMVDGAGRPWGLECNPRTTSGLHFFREADIAPAILAPDTAPPLGFRAERRLQQFWSCLTETQHAFGDWPRFRAHLRHLVGTPDVTWQARDPLPLLTMPWTAWPIIRLARERGVAFGEIATLDVGWAG